MANNEYTRENHPIVLTYPHFGHSTPNSSENDYCRHTRLFDLKSVLPPESGFLFLSTSVVDFTESLFLLAP